MPQRIAVILLPLLCLGVLGGCGDSALSRGTSGAAIGAGTGAAVCAVTVIGILPCAVVGGALGAAGGTATAGPDEAPPEIAAAPPTALAAAPADTPSAGNDPIAAPSPRVGVTAEPLN